MTSMLQRKRSFFSQDSGSVGSSSSSSHNGSSDHLPMLVESRHCESPPPSDGYGSAGSLYAMDFGALNRTAPGRATSMSIVRQRSSNSLSPSTKNRPRKSISMFFSSSAASNSHSFGVSSSASSCSAQTDGSSVDYSMPHYYHHHQQHNNPYGMLHVGPLARKNSNSSNNTNWIATVFCIMGLITFSVLAVSTYEHNVRLHQELNVKEQEIEMHLEHAHALERRVQGMRSETIHLHNRIEELEHPPKPTPEELTMQRKLFHLEHSQEQVHNGIAATSKRLLQQKYGPGPRYYVEMKLAFDPESNIVQDATTEIENTIWLETASMEEMPHTVHFFLEQVSNGIYDNTAFYANAPRFVQAGPGHDPNLLQQLEQDQPSLAHVLFQEEQSLTLNHQQYTLAYPGRPGGPDFYLNFQDNADQKPHGLGVNVNSNSNPQHSEFMAQVDPCFARVIQGFNTLERIHRSNIVEEDIGHYRRKQYRMVHPVTIVDMKVHNMKNTQPQATATTTTTTTQQQQRR